TCISKQTYISSTPSVDMQTDNFIPAPVKRAREWRRKTWTYRFKARSIVPIHRLAGINVLRQRVVSIEVVPYRLQLIHVMDKIRVCLRSAATAETVHVDVRLAVARFLVIRTHAARFVLLRNEANRGVVTASLQHIDAFVIVLRQHNDARNVLRALYPHHFA